MGIVNAVKRATTNIIKKKTPPPVGTGIVRGVKNVVNNQISNAPPPSGPVNVNLGNFGSEPVDATKAALMSSGAIPPANDGNLVGAVSPKRGVDNTPTSVSAPPPIGVEIPDSVLNPPPQSSPPPSGLIDVNLGEFGTEPEDETLRALKLIPGAIETPPPSGFNQPPPGVDMWGPYDTNPPPGDEEPPPTGIEMEDLLKEQIYADATGESTEVSAERERLDREKIQTLNNALQSAHERAVQAGFRPSSQQYDTIMNGARSDAERRNIKAENNLNQFARDTRMGVRSEMAAIGEMEYYRLKDSNEQADQDIFKVIDSLPSDISRQLAMVNQMSGGDTGAYISSLYKDGEFIGPKDPTGTQLAIDSLVETFSKIPNNPETDKPWVEGEQETYAAELYAEMQKQVMAPIGDRKDVTDAKTESEDRIDTAMTNNDYSSMMPGDWKNVSDTQLSEMDFDTVTDSKTFLRTSDWDASGLTADVVREEVDDKTWQQDSSAGDGKGSIVMYNNSPYRITLYRTKKDTTGTNERMGEYVLSPMDGDSADVTISTGWKDI